MTTPTRPWYIIATHQIDGRSMRIAHPANGDEDNDRYDAAVAATPDATVVLWRDLRVPSEWVDSNDVIDWGEDVIDDLDNHGPDRLHPARLHDPHGAYRTSRALSVAGRAGDASQDPDPDETIEALTEALGYFVNTTTKTAATPLGARTPAPPLPSTPIPSTLLYSEAATARLEALLDLPTILAATNPAGYLASLVAIARSVHTDPTFPDHYSTALKEVAAWVLTGRGPVAGQS